MTLVFVEHDETFVKKVATKVVDLDEYRKLVLNLLKDNFRG